MPTDAELRALFRDIPAPKAELDAATVIRRSRRRRLPQQLGLGSVLTLAVAGLAVAGFTGLNGLSPIMMAADAPAGVEERASEAGGEQAPHPTDVDSVAGQPAPCALLPEAVEATGLAADAEFAQAAPTGQPLAGTITLTNTGTQPANGTFVAAMVALSRDGVQVWHRDDSAAGERVALAADEHLTMGVSITAVGCAEGADATPLEPGRYQLTPVILVDSPDGGLRIVRGQASAITIR